MSLTEDGVLESAGIAAGQLTQVAEAALRDALVVSCGWQMRTFALRAASFDLARLYCDTSREREAVPLQQGALVGFAETPERPEIAEARRLLASLATKG